MPIRLASRRQQSGLSLIEVLIATVVLSTGLLGLAGLQIAGMKTTHNSYQMQQATWIVHDLLERMRSNRAAALAENYNVTPTTVCPATPPACGSGVCTPAELAAYDLCGANTSISNTLINGALTVTCFDPSPAGSPAADPPADCNVSLQWNERDASQADPDDATDGMESFIIKLKAIL
ncbi:type IV pilus modification protein PilV [Thiothrix subterranea]|uniref:type IV pilus modification protein PilV n=1 Tax=Thiothrix subterranea TaxID=2735563 RepID=UPI00192C56EF|nr:type IV pilus modification protein PilV [Thiothrix subterranea]QQZ30107.1 type IV pilus modification protein PilV [Thiothrix subterranea]